MHMVTWSFSEHVCPALSKRCMSRFEKNPRCCVLAKCDDYEGASRAYLLQRLLLQGHPVFMAI